MELVRHTIEFIKRKPYGNKLLIKVKDEVKLVIDATRDMSRMTGRKSLNRIKEYRPPRLFQRVSRITKVVSLNPPTPETSNWHGSEADIRYSV